MRARKTAALLALSGFVLLCASSPAVAHRRKPCAVPRSWTVVAHDRQAIVIAQRHKQQPAYDYCNRAVRSGWRGLVRPSPESFVSFFQPASPLLAGRYLAFALVSEPPQPSSIELWDTRSGQHTVLTDGGFVAGFSLPTLLLSPHGVAAAIDVTSRYTDQLGQHVAQPPVASITALTLHTQQGLDSASPPAAIANLQLYDCSAGCPPNTTIVAWTNSGQQRYSQISP